MLNELARKDIISIFPIILGMINPYKQLDGGMIAGNSF
jgi:hypothetical protein